MRILYDLSVATWTGGGTGVYAWEILHRLMRLSPPLSVMPIVCPVPTAGRTGPGRVGAGLFRDLIWNPFLSRGGVRPDDLLFFPVPVFPGHFKRRRYVTMVPDLAAWHTPEILTWRGRIAMRGWPDAIRRAESIITISEYTRQDIVREFGYPVERIHIAMPGLSETFRTPSGRCGGIPYILHTGAFEPKKNIPFLLRVFARLKAGRETPLKLKLTGGEHWRSSAEFKAIREHPFADDIEILGRVAPEDLAGLYAGAGALVFPSTFEGFGIPVIEALSQGTPALVHANSSLTEFGKYGASVLSDFDEARWASTLRTILAEGTRVEIHRDLYQDFSWDTAADTIRKVLLPQRADAPVS